MIAESGAAEEEEKEAEGEEEEEEEEEAEGGGDILQSTASRQTARPRPAEYTARDHP